MTDFPRELDYCTDLVCEILQDAVAAGAFPGWSLALGSGGKAIYAAGGALGLGPYDQCVDTGTLYDLASLTKLYTLAAYLAVARQCNIGPDTPVANVLPGFPREIEFEHLLNHSAGLGLELQALERLPPEDWLGLLAQTPLRWVPGTRVQYSCSPYFVLARAVERLAGQSLDQIIRDLILEPLGLRATNFAPDLTRQSVAPTEEQPDGSCLHGVVHDEAARAWRAATGTCAGNAGLFATATEVASFAQIWMQEGCGVLHPADVRLALTRTLPENSYRRGWGFQLDANFYMSEDAPPGTAGHLGFTGPSLVLNPATGHLAVLLCNRVHPNRLGPDRLPYFRRIHQCLFQLP